jgi:hypothetical protein
MNRKKDTTKRVKPKRKTIDGGIHIIKREEEHVDPYNYRGGKSNSTKQAIIFDRHIWDVVSAKKWIKKHNIKPIKPPHLTDNFIRFRLEDPNKFKRFATIKTKEGIDIIIAFE